MTATIEPVCLSLRRETSAPPYAGKPYRSYGRVDEHARSFGGCAQAIASDHEHLQLEGVELHVHVVAACHPNNGAVASSQVACRRAKIYPPCAPVTRLSRLLPLAVANPGLTHSNTSLAISVSTSGTVWPSRSRAADRASNATWSGSPGSNSNGASTRPVQMICHMQPAFIISLTLRSSAACVKFS